MVGICQGAETEVLKNTLPFLELKYHTGNTMP